MNFAHVLATTLSVALAIPAAATVVDSPLPVFSNGEQSKHIFSIPGVIHGNQLATAFTCTSLEKTKTVHWGVELFEPAFSDNPMNDIELDEGVTVLHAGDSDTIVTSTIAALGADEQIAASGLHNGALPGRIVATSTKIMCSAVVMDKVGDPPSAAYRLPLIRKKQRGD